MKTTIGSGDFQPRIRGGITRHFPGGQFVPARRTIAAIPQSFGPHRCSGGPSNRIISMNFPPEITRSPTWNVPRIVPPQNSMHSGSEAQPTPRSAMTTNIRTGCRTILVTVAPTDSDGYPRGRAGSSAEPTSASLLPVIRSREGGDNNGNWDQPNPNSSQRDQGGSVAQNA